MRYQLTPYRRESLWDFMREMDNIFDGNHGANQTPQFLPAVDLMETEDSFLVSVDIPGMNEKDIKIDVHNGRLTLKGERNSNTSSKDKGFKRIERSYGRFERTFQLPNDVEEDKIQAAYENGVLEILIPKKVETKPRSLQVETKKGGLFSNLLKKETTPEETKTEKH